MVGIILRKAFSPHTIVTNSAFFRSTNSANLLFSSDSQCYQVRELYAPQFYRHCIFCLLQNEIFLESFANIQQNIVLKQH